MNLQQLYSATPVSRHADILTDGAHVYVKNADGDLDHYLLMSDGQLWQVPGDVNLAGMLRQAKTVIDNLTTALDTATKTIDTLNTALGQARTAIAGLQTDTTAIRAWQPTLTTMATNVAAIKTKTGA
jgi:hypothetical protein